MPHETALLATIAGGLGLAFVLGFVAVRLRLPPIVGYLLAGIVIGPFSPGWVADTRLAAQLAEVGVILLMFGVGLHFSARDLIAVRRVATAGALTQIAVAATLGAALARTWGWSWGAAAVFGLALSVSSTVVVLRVLGERGMLDSVPGRIAVGWLVVEDLAMVLVLVLLPALAPVLGGAGGAPALAGGLTGVVAVTLGKVAAFVLLMLVAGRRAVPWLLERVARTGSRELFTLAVLAVALGIAFGAASLFGVSFALGAFFAGVVISESDVSHQAAADALPLQDAFAVLFFVSVGMLFDPAVLVRAPLSVLAVLLVVVFGQALPALAVVLAARQPLRPALVVAASFGQIGEFSFILAGLGVSLALLPAEGRNLVLAGALLSITVNPLLVGAVGPLERWVRARPRLLAALERPGRTAVAPLAAAGVTALADHAVIVGHGRVGGTIADALARAGVPYVVVERDRQTVEALRRRGVPAIFGDAARPGILAHAQVRHARLLVVTAPEPYQARRAVELAREANPGIDTVVRTHSEAEQAYLERAGVGRAVMGERELARGMAEYALEALTPVAPGVERASQAAVR